MNDKRKLPLRCPPTSAGNLAAWIRQTRRRQNLTAAQCAERAGVMRCHWSIWERSRDGWIPRRETINKIATGLGVSEREVCEQARLLVPDCEEECSVHTAFGRRFTVAINACGLSVRDVAAELVARGHDCDGRMVTGWMMGIDMPPVTFLASIARLTGTTTDYLLAVDLASRREARERTLDVCDGADIHQPAEGEVRWIP